MSSNEKTAWRASNSQRQQPSRGGSGASTPTNQPRPRPESGNYSQAAKGAAQPAAPPVTNAWADRAKSAQHQVSRKPTPAQAQAAHASATPSVNKHTPVRQFNSAEVKEYFCKGFAASTAGGLASQALYRPSAEAKKPAGNPWGAKAQNTANGRSFWAQLNKQVSAAELGRGG